MDLDTFQRLRNAEGQHVLEAAVALKPTTESLLACHRQLRKQFPDDLVAAAIEIAFLRQKGTIKFTKASEMYFVREALEQSSSEIVSRHRAERFKGRGRVGDFCCGIGGDLIALSEVSQVTAFDSDPLRLAMAEANLEVYGRRDRADFLLGDVLTMPLPTLDALFIDPDRRSEGTRHLRLADYSPPLEAFRSRFPKDFPMGVKVAPGIPWSDLDGVDAEKEFISVRGELKECVLWFGDLKQTSKRATLLPANVSYSVDYPGYGAPPDEPKEYLYDPDSAIVRAGLVGDLGQMLNAHPIDSDVAYLTSDSLILSPYATVYRLEASLPFHPKKVAEWLRTHQVGPMTMHKRGSTAEVDQLRRQWKLKGNESRHLHFTRVLGKQYVLIGTKIESG